MELRIQMLDSNNDLLVFTDEKFKESVVSEIRDYCCLNERFHIYDEKENLVAEISAFFIDECRSYSCGLSITTVADYMSQELLDAIQVLVKTEDYDEIILTPAYTCYIQTLYVYPEFRNMGIGKYLWENIVDIFEYFMKKDIHAIIVYPKPHTITIKNEDTFEKEPIEDDEMLQKMKNGLISGGYKEINNSNYYMRIFLDE